MGGMAPPSPNEAPCFTSAWEKFAFLEERWNLLASMLLTFFALIVSEA
jgi:hypothetical protein